jgi:hypothetical protein
MQPTTKSDRKELGCGKDHTRVLLSGQELLLEQMRDLLKEIKKLRRSVYYIEAMIFTEQQAKEMDARRDGL